MKKEGCRANSTSDFMMKILGFIQIVHLSKEKKKGHKVNSTSCDEKKKGVDQIVQVGDKIMGA